MSGGRYLKAGAFFRLLKLHVMEALGVGYRAIDDSRKLRRFEKSDLNRRIVT